MNKKIKNVDFLGLLMVIMLLLPFVYVFFVPVLGAIQCQSMDSSILETLKSSFFDNIKEFHDLMLSVPLLETIDKFLTTKIFSLSGDQINYIYYFIESGILYYNVLYICYLLIKILWLVPNICLKGVNRLYE